MKNRRESFSDLIDRLEKQLRENWEELPEPAQSGLASSWNRLPSNLKNWRVLIDQAADHLRTVVGGKQIVVIVGPANVGKSTLYNQLV